MTNKDLINKWTILEKNSYLKKQWPQHLIYSTNKKQLNTNKLASRVLNLRREGQFHIQLIPILTHNKTLNT